MDRHAVRALSTRYDHERLAPIALSVIGGEEVRSAEAAAVFLDPRVEGVVGVQPEVPEPSGVQHDTLATVDRAHVHDRAVDEIRHRVAGAVRVSRHVDVAACVGAVAVVAELRRGGCGEGERGHEDRGRQAERSDAAAAARVGPTIAHDPYSGRVCSVHRFDISC